MGATRSWKLLAPASAAGVAWVAGASVMTLLGRTGAPEVIGCGAVFLGLSTLLVGLCLVLSVKRLTALFLTLAGAAAIPFVATFVASPVLRPVIVLPEAGWIFGAPFGGFLVLPVALGRDLARSRSHDAAPLVLGALGAWTAASTLLCLGALALARPLAGPVDDGAPIALASAVAVALAGLAAAAVGGGRLLRERRWLARVRRGQDDEWTVLAGCPAEELAGLRPFTHGAEGSEEVLARRSRGPRSAVYRTGEMREPLALVGRGSAECDGKKPPGCLPRRHDSRRRGAVAVGTLRA